MIRPLLLLAAYLALASAQCGEHATREKCFSQITGKEFDCVSMILVCEDDTHIDGHATHDASGNPVTSGIPPGSRRLSPTTRTSGIRSDGLLLFFGGVADPSPNQKMSAVYCFNMCQETVAPSFYHLNTHWQMGPVRDHAERDHIASVINNFFVARVGYPFWPDNSTEVEAVKRENGGKIPLSHSIWIGHYGDAGQGNATLPFTLDGGSFYKEKWNENFDQLIQYTVAQSFQDDNDVWTYYNPFYYRNFSMVSNYTKPNAWYPWRPFANMEWIDPSFTDFATGQPTLAPIKFKAPDPLGSSKLLRNGEWLPKACVKMGYSWDGVNNPDVNTNGKWRNAPCSAASTSIAYPDDPDDNAQVCFCRAVCSVDAAQVCLARRRCSDDGTSIMTNFEFDYVSCACNEIPAERCCTECSGKDDPYLTGGRLVPTECRGLVPGDPGYNTQIYTKTRVDLLSKNPATGNFWQNHSEYPAVLEGERPYKACRRILFGNPKKPIFLGDGRITTAPDQAQGNNLGMRRDLPLQ